jgi:hypothetical protein
VESIFKSDHGWSPRVVARHFDGVLDGFGAAVHKQGALLKRAGGELVEALGQGDVGRVGRDGERDMEKF